MVELTLQGENYSGRFSATKKHKEFSVGSGYYTYLENNYWWEGIGEIKEKNSGEEIKFLMRTDYNPYGKEKRLEECLIDIKGKWANQSRPNSIITNKEKVIDLILKEMYESAKNNQTEIIPEVWSKKLSYEELLDKGFVIEEETGQIRLPLGK